MLEDRDKVPNEVLLECGLDLMKQNGKPLTKMQTKGRAMIYAMPDKLTVRIRTCNDHLLVVLADRDAEDAKLNVEGTDFILIVMPTTPRSHGPVAGFLVPSEIVAEAARSTHREWRAGNPNTKGENRTWNLWFSDNGPHKASGFARKWSAYLLNGRVSTQSPSGANLQEQQTAPAKLGEIIAIAKSQIAEAAGVTPNAVHISIDLS